MGFSITPEEIAAMKAYLKAHPPDPGYDWSDDTLDADIPVEEFNARCYRDILQLLGELPEEPK